MVILKQEARVRGAIIDKYENMQDFSIFMGICFIVSGHEFKKDKNKCESYTKRNRGVTIVSRKLKLLVVVFVTLLVHSACSAASWQWMASTDRIGYNIDPSTIQVTNSYEGLSVEAWFKFVYVPPLDMEKGYANYALKKIKITIPNDKQYLPKYQHSRVTYYNDNGSVIDAKWGNIPYSTDIKPWSEEEEAFAVLIDYFLGLDQQWLQKVKKTDRWIYASTSKGGAVTAAIDQYLFDITSGSGYVYVYWLHDDSSKSYMESKYVQLNDRKFGFKEVLPESVGEGILSKISILKNNPTQEMQEWRNAIAIFKVKLQRKVNIKENIKVSTQENTKTNANDLLKTANDLRSMLESRERSLIKGG